MKLRTPLFPNLPGFRRLMVWSFVLSLALAIIAYFASLPFILSICIAAFFILNCLYQIIETFYDEYQLRSSKRHAEHRRSNGAHQEPRPSGKIRKLS
jgi:hypothetical protein